MHVNQHLYGDKKTDVLIVLSNHNPNSTSLKFKESKNLIKELVNPNKVGVVTPSALLKEVSSFKARFCNCYAKQANLI